jgi:teichuronic acid biosynthesis glycosyltransferase TuaG
MTEPLVSIVMPAFNACLTISQAIDSVLLQKYKNWELLLVNDCSTDKTGLIAEQYADKDSRIKVLSNRTNQGVARSRNLALEARSGDYVSFLDADDLWLDNKLSTQISSLSSKTVFSYMPYSMIDQNGKFIRSYFPPKSIDYKTLLLGNVMGALTVTLQSEFMGNAKFPLRGHEDYALWLSLLRKGGIAIRSGDDSGYAKYRIHSSSLTSSKLRAASWQWEIYREEEGLSILKSSALMCSYAYRALIKRF